MYISSAIPCSSKYLPSSLLQLPAPHRFIAPFNYQHFGPLSPLGLSEKFPAIFSSQPQHTSSLVCCTATTKIVERKKVESEFVEIGYVCSVHGLQGEVTVKPRTDFPELRFSKPGKRWLRQQVSGGVVIQEIELVEGRGYSSEKTWIIKFNEIDSVDQALKLVGSTVLVPEEDRPELEEGEFYTRDLVGMTVILKETGERVGTVVNVFNSGASDLLHVELKSSVAKSNLGEAGPLVWVPFVEAIVPDVDIRKREMLITPPKGLLELNVRSDERSKKERRQLEWKERKKFQKLFIAAKKKLLELDQEHVFDGFKHGEKSQTNLLANQIVTVNSKLFKQALHILQMPDESNMKIKSAFKIPEECFSVGARKQFEVIAKLQEEGLCLTSHGKLAIVLVLEDSVKDGNSDHDNTILEENEKTKHLVEAISNDDQKFIEYGARPSVPLILVSPGNLIGHLQQLFIDNDYFGFAHEKVCFLEEEKLPVVSTSVAEPKKHKILMKSPWEILQKPVGSGGVISLLSSTNLLDNLSESGVEYIEVCNVMSMHRVGGDRETLLGLVDSRKANIGIHGFFKNTPDTNFDVILFSMDFMKKLRQKQIHNKLDLFQAITNQNRHIQRVNNDWVEIVPSSLPNSFEFHSSIYSCLHSCDPSEICVLH